MKHIPLSKSIQAELKSSLPDFRFQEAEGRRVKAKCKSCFLVDRSKLVPLMRGREALGAGILADEQASKKKYLSVAKGISKHPPSVQRKMLREARIIHETVSGDLNPSNYIRPLCRTFNTLLEAVDWALSHDHGVTEYQASMMVLAMIEHGVDPDSDAVEPPITWETGIDLLNLVD
jgi:hypothetical protein